METRWGGQLGSAADRARTCGLARAICFALIDPLNLAQARYHKRRRENLRLAFENLSQVVERLGLVEYTECARQRAIKLYVVAGRRDFEAVSGSIRAQSVPGPEKVNEKGLP